ncbi:MAG: hypothetical protein P8I03_02435 [Thalassotalea sp.]|nr:hypothetical protein [Thalassotalea sp.]
MTLMEQLVFPVLSLNEQLMMGALLLVSLAVIYRATLRLFNSSPLRLLLVVIANLLSVIAVVLLIIPVQVKHHENDTITLLTSGFNHSAFNEERLCFTKSKIYYLTSIADKQVKKNVSNNCDLSLITINHISELSIFEPDINQLEVYGDGLSATQWQHVEPLKTTFYPSELKSGFIEPQWSKEATLGESVNFTAKLQISRQNARFDRIHTVQLIDVNGELLSEVKAKHDEIFSFNIKPKAIGQHLYRIHLLENSASAGEANTVLIDESVAVNITESTLPRVLIIQSSPKYETKHFKHWLTENNGQLLTLTQISKENVLSEEVNLSTELSSSLSFSKESSIQTIDEFLTASLFDHFDLLMVDAKVLLSVNDDKLALIDNAVKNGLGLLVSIEQSLANAINDNLLLLFSDFQQQVNPSHINSTSVAFPTEEANLLALNYLDKDESANNHIKQVMLNWQNKTSEHLIDANNTSLQNYNAAHLVFDQNKQPLMISNNRGKGKIALTTINSSFQLKINGMYDEYSQFWQFITTELASNKQPMFWLEQPNKKIVFKGEMAKACLLAERELISSSSVSQVNNKEQTMLYLHQQAENENKHCSSHFSNNAGWQQVLFSAENDSKVTFSKPQYIYQYETNDWEAWQQALIHSDSDNKVRKSKVISEKNIINEHTEPVNKLVVFWVLFICSSFLWIERKLY